MRQTPEKPKGGTALAMHFNLRHRSGQPVSPQTAHKWLSGRTIPTPDKLQTLAEWFGVDLHWLHYGPSPGVPSRGIPKPVVRGEKYQPSPEIIELATKIDSMSPHDRYLLQEIVTKFYGDDSHK